MLVPGPKSWKFKIIILPISRWTWSTFLFKGNIILAWSYVHIMEPVFLCFRKNFTLTSPIFSEKTMLHYLAKNCLYFHAFCVFNGLICSLDGNPLVGSYKISISHISPIPFKWNIPFYSFLFFSHLLIWSVHGKWKRTFNCKSAITPQIIIFSQKVTQNYHFQS